MMTCLQVFFVSKVCNYIGTETFDLHSLIRKYLQFEDQSVTPLLFSHQRSFYKFQTHRSSCPSLVDLHLITLSRNILSWNIPCDFFPPHLLPPLLPWIQIYTLWSRIMKAAEKIINERFDSSFAANSGGSSSYSAWRPVLWRKMLKRKSQQVWVKHWLCLSHKSMNLYKLGSCQCLLKEL